MLIAVRVVVGFNALCSHVHTGYLSDSSAVATFLAAISSPVQVKLVMPKP